MENNTAKEMTRLAIEALEDKKAEDIHVIDISEVSVIADYFIIAGGSNKSQIQAMCDNVQEKLGRAGYPEKQTEGYQTANWILLDFGDVIVHIFDKENRLLYDLERIWRDGKQIDVIYHVKEGSLSFGNPRKASLFQAFLFDFSSSAEVHIEAYQVQSANAHYGVYDSGKPRHVAEYIGNQVKSEQTNQSPVYCTDNGNGKGSAIQKLVSHILPLFCTAFLSRLY